MSEGNELWTLMRILSNATTPIVGKQLAKMVNAELKTDFEDVNVREWIKVLRNRGVAIVCAGSKGYYLSDDAEEIQAQAESLKNRARVMIRTAEIMQRTAEKMKVRKANGGF